MRSSDQMLVRTMAEIEEKQTFIDGIVEVAEADGRDLNAQEMEMVTRARDRQQDLNAQAKEVGESVRISVESRERVQEIGRLISNEPERPARKDYQTAGEYVMDRWRAGLGMNEAVERVDLYHRAAAHQTTSDNPGLLPEQILGPIINFVDESRPLTNALGPRQLPSGSWSRPHVTQHTNVAPQASGEKTELVSRKMTIAKLPVTAVTYGGYVNVSRQDIDWTSPSIMDIVINDLAGYYAQVTEAALGTALVAAATAGATGLGTTPTPEEVAAAIWSAAAAIYSATKGQGRLIIAAPPDMLGLIGPLFAPVNPQNAQSTGFGAGQFGTGAMGAVSGVQVVVTAGLAAGSMLVLSTASAEVYEDRIGSLQVVEPSVLGVQVAYAGYYAPLVISAAGIIKLTSA